MHRLVWLVCLFLCCSHLGAQPFEKWGDQGDGTYRNPVLPADYSDLDAIRVGDNFYAISSTMQFSPGMVVLHSVDLVNWEIIGHVVKDLTAISPELNWNRMNCYGKGIWAGSIRYYKNRFWVYFGTPDDGFFMSSAENPAGPWEPLHHVWNVKGWDDCCSFCDEDGQLYFVATHFALDPKNNRKYNIHLFKMAPDGRSLLLESDTIIHQSTGSEANKLYKINGIYYHYFSEVTSEGRVMMMERSVRLTGPWEIRQLNHVHAATDKEPNQGGLLQVSPDRWCFFTHHGTGSWEGRAASLLPVRWMEGWPVVGVPGADSIGRMVWGAVKPISTKSVAKIQTSDEFDQPFLGVQWEWNYQPRAEKWSLTERKGFLRLHAFVPLQPENRHKLLLRAGNTLTQRSMRTKANVATAKLDLRGMADGQRAGMTHFTTTGYSFLCVERLNGRIRLVYEADGKDSVLLRLKGHRLWIRSSWNANGTNGYSYSSDGKRFTNVNAASQLTWGSYRGDRVGLFCYNLMGEGGYVDVDYFRYDYTTR